jgi:high affinity sulfate transporter 1
MGNGRRVTRPAGRPPVPAQPSVVERWVPAIGVVRRYRAGWFVRDLTAGLVLTSVLVPAGMGYAQVAGLPAIYGLYATIVPLTAYAIFGPSRILILGPDSALAPLIAATVLPLAGGDVTRAVALAGMLAIWVGAICVLAGLARFGFITDLLSAPVRAGYLNGIALTIVIGQLPKLFGFSVHARWLPREAWAFAAGLAHGETNPTALVIGAGCLGIILGFRRWAPGIPGILVAVVLATVISAALDLAIRTGIVVLGPLPQGLPSFQVPAVSLLDAGRLAAGALGISLLAFADTSVLSRTFAIRGGYQVDPNHELMALGVANVAGGLFQGFAVSSSSSRTPVAEAAGAKTQVAGLVGAGAIAVLLVFVPGLLQDLPESALAAVVIAAALSLASSVAMLRLLRIRRSEFILSTASFLGVALLGVLWGVFVAIGLSLLNFVRLAWWPHEAVLGRVDHLKGYHDLERFPQARQVPGLLLYRFDAPLFFANAEVFHGRLRARIAAADPAVRWVVVAAEPITDVDITAGEMLDGLLDELADAGIVLAFAEMKDPVKDRLRRYGSFDRIGADRFFPTMGVALDAYLEATGAPWVDWEEAGAEALEEAAEPSEEPE